MTLLEIAPAQLELPGADTGGSSPVQGESNSFKVRPGTKVYHGSPCKNCGNTLRYAGDRQCIPCNRRNNRKFAEANPDRTRSHMRKSWLRRWYGITPEDFERMLQEQDGRCAICRTDDPSPWRVFGVDHDHESGRIRGLLCDRCNSGIARFREDPDVLRRALAYLEATA
jgi:hypothetical protein